MSYGLILKTFLDNKKIPKKIPFIPSLLLNGKFIMDIKEKAELFSDFFIK